MNNTFNNSKNGNKNNYLSPRQLPAILTQIHLNRKQAQDILLQKSQGDLEGDTRDSVSEFQQLSSTVILIQDIKRSLLSLRKYQNIVESYNQCIESHLHEADKLSKQILQQMTILNITNSVVV